MVIVDGLHSTSSWVPSLKRYAFSSERISEKNMDFMPSFAKLTRPVSTSALPCSS